MTGRAMRLTGVNWVHGLNCGVPAEMWIGPRVLVLTADVDSGRQGGSRA